MSTAKLKPGTTILVVDDTPEILTVVKKMLAYTLNATVVCAENGQIAKDIILGREKSFDLIFTDLEMPVMDGRQFAEWIRVTEPRTPIIMLTGEHARISPEDRPDVDVFLPKPVTPDTLVIYVTSLIPRCIVESAPIARVVA